MPIIPQLPYGTKNGVTRMNLRYALTYAEVNSLIKELQTPSFLDNISKLFSDPMSNIISLSIFPFDVAKLYYGDNQTTEKIKINIVTLSTSGVALGSNAIPDLRPSTTPLLDLGSATISPHFNNFLDYAPYTKIELYLPYVGFVTLNNSEVLGKTIRIKYAVDLYSGKCTAFVTAGDSSTETIILTRTGDMGVQIQIAGSSGAEISRRLLNLGMQTTQNTVNYAAGLAGSIATGNVVGGVTQTTGYLSSTALNAVSAMQQPVIRSGSMSPANNLYSPQYAYIVYTRPRIVRPANYNHHYGRPCGRQYKLADLSGYTVIDRCDMRRFTTATKSEIDEIESLLKSGVIL